MIKFYLCANSFFYLLFAVLCLFNPGGTSQSLGLDFLNGSGKTEYLAVYTGLELGMAFFLAISAFRTEYNRAGLIFCVCVYAALMLVRPLAAFASGNILLVTYLVMALEYLIGIWGFIVLAIVLKKK